MNTSSNYLIISFMVLALFSPQLATGNGNTATTIGAVVDTTSRAGKEAKLAMEMAIEDFTRTTNITLVDLQIRNSQGKPFQAALAARDLIDKHQVNAIIGPHIWDQVSSIAEVTSDDHIPTLSLAHSTPEPATSRWPFLVQASPIQKAQMKAVAAIIQSHRWRRVNIMYEIFDSTSDQDIQHLFDALRLVAEVSHNVSFPPSPSASLLSEELEKLKKDNYCRVFVVHTSLELGIRLFYHANKMKMMGKGYVWITTNTITNLVHSINASAMSSMHGILGVKSYFPKINEPQFQDFDKQFRKKFATEYGKEEKNEPGIFGVQAYDATRRVALALKETNLGGKILLEKSNEARIFQIVNIDGKKYEVIDLGFWSDHGLGFSNTTDNGTRYNSSMQNLWKVIWPGGELDTPRGWDIPTPLKVGVPNTSLFKEFVNVTESNYNGVSITNYTGFCVEVFNKTIKSLLYDNLPYDLPYEFFPFNGSYDELVEAVYNETFDAVAGDVTATANRSKLADFTIPYTESGMEMIVPIQSIPKNPWLFLKPFTMELWLLILAITIYNGFVLWLIERNHRPELKGSVFNQIGTLLSLAFTTLFSLHGGKLHSNFSRMAIVVWLFVALILIESHTANLASMLTAQRLQPTVSDIETLKEMNASVGYCRGTFIDRYLVNVLNFHPKSTQKFYTTEEYAEALKSGNITALFLEVPSAKLFLSQYCNSFIRAGPTFKIGGFGFVFSKGFPLLANINQAILKVSESGELQNLEETFIGNKSCTVDMDEIGSINLNSLWVLFVLTGSTSTIALAIYAIASMSKRRFSNRVGYTESPRSPPTSPPTVLNSITIQMAKFRKSM